MTYSQTRRKRTILIAGAGLLTLLAGCATTTTKADTASANTPMNAEKMAMHADCQAMHDTMMAGNAMGEMQDHKMMSPEMMEKHQACMEMMPDMKVKMQEKCAAHKAGTMDHDMMGKAMMDHEKMGDHCAMMQSHDDGAGQ
jgi:outer membrane murein-binding lipoprotein Lpp